MKFMVASKEINVFWGIRKSRVTIFQHFWKNWLFLTKRALKPLIGVGKVGRFSGRTVKGLAERNLRSKENLTFPSIYDIIFIERKNERELSK